MLHLFLYQYRSRLVQNQSTDLESKKSSLNQKKSELVVIDEKIAQLPQRLAKKRHINQQLSYQMQSTQATLSGPGIGLNNQFNALRGTSSHSYKRLPINQQRSTVPNIAAVEPIQRLQQPQSAEDPTEVCDTYQMNSLSSFSSCYSCSFMISERKKDENLSRV